MKTTKYKGWTIQVWVVVMDGSEIVGEYDSMEEAHDAWQHCTWFKFLYAAAEIIDEDGNLNPPIFAETKRGAVERVKALLT